MHDPAFERRPRGDYAVATGDYGSLAHRRPTLRVRCTVRTRDKAVDLALAYCDPYGFDAEKPGGRFDYCVQHRLHIGGRAADDVEHVAGRGLVLERLVALGSAFGKLTVQIGYYLLAIG